MNWNNIPERFPIHWGLDGQVDGWGNRSFANVFMLPLIGVTVCAFLAFLIRSLAPGVRRIYSSGPEAAKESRHLKTMLHLLLASEYLIAVMLSVMACLPFIVKSDGSQFPANTFAIFAAVVPLLFMAAVLYSQPIRVRVDGE